MKLANVHQKNFILINSILKEIYLDLNQNFNACLVCVNWPSLIFIYVWCRMVFN